MASFNKVLLLGNLTRDPRCVIRKGSAMRPWHCCQSRLYDRQRGEAKKPPLWMPFWGRTRRLPEVSEKGRPIFIEGRLQLDSWEDKQPVRSFEAEGDWRDDAASWRTPRRAPVPLLTRASKIDNPIPAARRARRRQNRLRRRNQTTTRSRSDFPVGAETLSSRQILRWRHKAIAK